jgi:hypothetical protein
MQRKISFEINMINVQKLRSNQKGPQLQPFLKIFYNPTNRVLFAEVHTPVFIQLSKIWIA